MKPHWRSFPSIALPILLAAGVFGLIVPRREEETIPAKLPEDLTAALKKAERDRIIAVLNGAGAHGLRPQDYLAGDVSDGLLLYANHRRSGRENPGIYGKPETISPDQLAAITEDPGGIEAGLRKVDPPFAEYGRLEAALAKARPEQRPLIEQALEHWRWLPHAFPNGAILVNLPEFRLQALDENNQTALEMRVIVGQTTHQTPLFTGKLKYVVFGPFWNVPSSILANEIVPDVEKDRKYLTRNAYEVLDAGGEVVSNDEVSDEVLAGLKSGELRVRQVPGAKNALGRVKFMFPNEDNIYLHDTNNHKLFAKERRDLSHGCVRVENPQALAEWVLRNEPAWTKGRIAAGLKQTKPQQANLKEATPVFMLYNTVTVGEDGEVHYWKDLYKLATTAGPGQHPRE
jgi:hypothetical protein